MSFLDLLIVAALIGAVARGLLQGAVMQLFPFGGFWIGLIVGSALAPLTARLAGSPGGKIAVSLITLFGVASLFSGVGRQVGVRAWRAIRAARLGPADSALGAGVAGVATTIGIWLLATILAGLPFPSLNRQIHGSAIIRTLDQALPPAPEIFSRVKQLIGANGFPDVFAGLEPQQAAPVPAPADPDVRAALDAAGAATVKIEGVGCGGIKTGSGFVAASGVVVTNAHVIAGIDNPLVEDRRGRHRTTPVIFDEDLDIAILRVSGLATALPVEGGTLQRGTGGAVLGYPGGGPLTAGGAAVMAEFEATGRDIYGQNLIRRNVYQLQAQVRPGNSGGPFVLPDGRVAGVIFSQSATNPDVGYAITTPEVIPLIQEGTRRESRADTGPCTA